MAQVDPVAQNAAARNAVLSYGQPIWLKVASLTQASNAYTAGQALVLNVPVQNVGLIRRFIVNCKFTVAQGAAETQTAQTFGGANALSQIVLTDFNNLVRVNTTGWHLSLLGTARRQMAFGAAFTSDTPFGIGANYNINKTPSSVTTSQTVYQQYEVPVAYSDIDLRGAMFAQLVNATANLQLTINPNFFVTSSGNGTQAVYKSSTAQLGVISAYTIDVYEETIDQLPRDGGGNFVLPNLDINTQYNILNVTQTGLAVGADFSLPFSNLRQFLSTFVIYDNAGTLNAGTDLNYISLTAANSLNLFKFDPTMLQLINGRFKINDDWPKGTYYLPSREKPISTLNFGNVALNINPSSVTAGAQLLVGYESMILTQQLQAAGSISAT
jgi:hypothetical protein